MEVLKPPSSLNFEGNVSENWKRWKQALEIFFVASDIDTKGDARKIATLLHVGGEQLIDVFNSFEWTETGDDEGDDKRYEKVVAKFERYCAPRKNITYMRYQFFAKTQLADESVDHFVTELRNRARECEFGPLTESLIRDRLICGIKDDNVRRRLLRETDVTLKAALDVCRANEATASQMTKLQTGQSQTVNAVEKRCDNCGYVHSHNRCPAFGKKCNACGKVGHFIKQCHDKSRSKRPSQRSSTESQVRGSGRNYSRGTRRQGRDHSRAQSRSRDVHVVEEDSETETEQFYVDSVDAQKSNDWKIKLCVNNRPMTCKIDTGAQCNVLPKNVYDDLGLNKVTQIEKVKTKLVAYNGSELKVLGQVTVLAEYKRKLFPVRFIVCNVQSPPILGAETCESELKVIQRVYSVVRDSVSAKELGHMSESDFVNVCEKNKMFTGLGCLDGEVTIKLRSDAQPVVHAPRTVPIALRSKLKSELKRMEELGVITKQIEPTEWVNSLVTVIKPNGKLRVCIDPKDLNNAIQREHYPMNTVEQVTSIIGQAKYFTVLDASSGYWQLKLDESSSKLCTFNTPFGRYRFLRLPFGVNAAAEIFQRRMATMFEGVEGVQTIQDDVLIHGQTGAEHDEKVMQTLEMMHKSKLKLNKEKCKFKRTKVAYVGHVLSSEGLQSDPEKVRAIREMHSPENVKDLQRFFGMLNYHGKFMENMSVTSSPLRKLLEKDVAWEWNREHQHSFTELKEKLCRAPVLAFFDENKKLTLSVDASSKGLGATLLQDKKPVAYASRALSKAECNYSQIEKEMLAIVWGCKKFHDYVAFRNVHVESDHKPLESIMKKPLYDVPLRLQRMRLQLQHYSLDVQYTKGTEIVIADALSRAYLPEVGECKDGPLEIHLVKEQTPVSEEKFEMFKTETLKDPELRVLIQVVMKGWPETVKKCPAETRPYWAVREDLTVVDGVLFKGARIVVPSSMRKDMLGRIHEAHQGVVRCKQRAREALYWPRMSSQIEELVARCSICNTHAKYQQRQPLQSHDIPNQPWSKVASDLFEIDGCQYCLITDYYSKYPEMVKLGKSSTSQAVITAMKSVFSRHGIPQTLVTDNGPCYASEEFKKFSRKWEFKHITSSPMYPRSNGLAERNVQTVKSLLKKSEDPYLALLEFRTTALDDIGLSPAQLLMGRRLRTRLPLHRSLLKPQLVNQKHVQHSLNHRQKKQKEYYDRGTRKLNDLKPGDRVRCWNQKDNMWKPAVVESESEQPRSYNIKTQQGSILRRNRQDLKTEAKVRFDLPNTEETIDDPNPIQKDNGGTTNIAEPEDTIILPPTNMQNNTASSEKVRRSTRVPKTPTKLKEYVVYHICDV